MIKKISIRLTAAFLMIVFSMNTVIGFACGLGMDLGFNKKCIPVDRKTASAHQVNSAGKKHAHESLNKHNPDQQHNDEDADAHKQAGNKKHNCCNDTVIKFEQLDKSVAQNISFISPIFSPAFIASYYYTDILHSFKGATPVKYFARSHHPPIPDIRIAIRSFQI